MNAPHGRHRRRLRALVSVGATLLATGLTVVAASPAAHADPGDISLHACTDPANQACFGPYTAVNLRNGPSTGYDREGVLYPGTIVSLCQVLGQNIGGNYIWDYVGVDPDRGTGLFVSDYYMNTPTFGTNRAYPCP